MRRIIVDQLDIAHQTGPGVGALNQVVAEQRIFRKTVLQRLPHHIHIVNAFTREDAFAKQVLIDVGNGARINIKPGLP